MQPNGEDRDNESEKKLNVTKTKALQKCIHLTVWMAWHHHNRIEHMHERDCEHEYIFERVCTIHLL